MFDTKIALVLRNDLVAWQALNVTAFLTTGVVAEHPGIISEPYRDRDGNTYSRMSIQPIIVLAADAGTLRTVHRRCLERGLPLALYVEEMFRTGHDAANREVFMRFALDDAKVVGLGLRAGKKLVDKVTKGARLHG